MNSSFRDIAGLNTNLYLTSVKFVQRKGKFSHTKFAFDQCVLALYKKENNHLFSFFSEFFSWFPFLAEVKTVKMRKKQVKYVPFPTNPLRRVYLRKKIIFSFLKSSSPRHQSLESRLLAGLLTLRDSAEDDMSCPSKHQYKEYMTQIRSCKSNLNFRWC